MATEIRPQVSEKNEYWIPKHRYYELMHFCRQYKGWKKAIVGLDGMAKAGTDEHVQTSDISNPTETNAMTREYYTRRIDMVDEAAEKTDPELARYLIAAVSEGCTYDKLQLQYDVLPCGRKQFYNKYREFFWNLHMVRE